MHRRLYEWTSCSCAAWARPRPSHQVSLSLEVLGCASLPSAVLAAYHQRQKSWTLHTCGYVTAVMQLAAQHTCKYVHLSPPPLSFTKAVGICAGSLELSVIPDSLQLKIRTTM